eukprot:CCRYP_001226-RA/>CCRYP_001226-RA protein AED:0.24 eAED:0.24 QI:74/1/1/1/1/1/2/87/281
MAPTPPQSAYHLYFRFYKNVLLRPSLQTAVIPGDKTNREQYKDFVQTVLDVDLNDSSLNNNRAQRKFIGNESFAGMSKDVSKKWKEVDPLTRSIFKELAAEDSERYKKELFDSYQSFAKSHSATMLPLRCIRSVRKDRHEGDIECAKVGVKASSNAACMRSDLGTDDDRTPSEMQTNQGQFQKRETVHKRSHNIGSSGYEIWAEDQRNRSQASRATSTSGYRQSQITEVDMADEEIISIAITVWGLSPRALNPTVRKDSEFVNDEGIGDFMSGIDWNMSSY